MQEEERRGEGGREAKGRGVMVFAIDNSVTALPPSPSKACSAYAGRVQALVSEAATAEAEGRVSCVFGGAVASEGCGIRKHISEATGCDVTLEGARAMQRGFLAGAHRAASLEEGCFRGLVDEAKALVAPACAALGLREEAAGLQRVDASFLRLIVEEAFRPALKSFQP
jgi:hypothetical protein